MKNKFYLQLFAEGDTTEQNTQTTETKTETGNTTHKDDKPESQLKYTDADVDKLINQKFAEWQKKQEKQTSEAERLGRMTAEEKANARMKAFASPPSTWYTCSIALASSALMAWVWPSASCT